MKPKLQSMVRSRRFWVAMAGVVVVASQSMGLNLAPAVVNKLVLLAASWIVGDSLRETK